MSRSSSLWWVLSFVLVVACGGGEATPEEGQGEDNAGAEGERVVVGARTGNGEACTAAGGRCVAMSECARGSGHLGGPLCGAPHLACCFTPDGSCGGPEDFECCVGSAVYRPTCQGGQLSCPDGATRAAIGACPGG